jgi:hypothetical protein
MPARPVPATKSSPDRPMSIQEEAPVFGVFFKVEEAEAVTFGVAVGFGLAVALGAATGTARGSRTSLQTTNSYVAAVP